MSPFAASLLVICGFSVIGWAAHAAAHRWQQRRLHWLAFWSLAMAALGIGVGAGQQIGLPDPLPGLAGFAAVLALGTGWNFDRFKQ